MPPKAHTKTSWLQIGYGVWVNMTVMGMGLNFGFPTAMIPQLLEPDSSIKITMSDAGWIASVLTLSGPIGSIISGVLMDKYGRKPVLVLCEVPISIGWFYTACATSVKDIIVGRVIAGIGLGMAASAPQSFITEITLPNMRGLIGALPGLFFSVGLAIQAGLGSFLDWQMICYICGGYSMALMVANSFLPDTPYFLLLTKTESKAAINMRKFRSANFSVSAEIAALFTFRSENDIRSLTMADQIKALAKPASYKPYCIATAFICFTQLAGAYVVIIWAVQLLELAKTSMNVKLGNIILALTRIVFGIINAILLFKVRRRIMAMISAFGVGVVAIGLCCFLYLNKEQSLIPLLILMAYIAFATLGYYTLPMLMMFEMLPLQLRGLLSGICISQNYLMMFAMNNSYPFLIHNLGLANTMGMYGGFSLLGGLVLFFILPETKGLTLQEIEKNFNKP